MKGNLLASSVLCGSLLLAALPVMGAGNGITKEDIKRLQVNAFAQEMQQEMEKSAFSELENSIADPDLNIKVDLASEVAEDNSMPSKPTITAR